MSHLLSLLTCMLVSQFCASLGFYSAWMYQRWKETVVYCPCCSGGANENNNLQHATDESITEEIHLFSNNLQLNNG